MYDISVSEKYNYVTDLIFKFPYLCVYINTLYCITFDYICDQCV